MKAFILERHGGGGAVRLGAMPDRGLPDDDVLVRVRAAGVNPLDARIRDGEAKLILPYRLPLILGNDVAGAFGATEEALAYVEARRAKGKVVVRMERT